MPARETPRCRLRDPAPRAPGVCVDAARWKRAAMLGRSSPGNERGIPRPRLDRSQRGVVIGSCFSPATPRILRNGERCEAQGKAMRDRLFFIEKGKTHRAASAGKLPGRPLEWPTELRPRRHVQARALSGGMRDLLRGAVGSVAMTAPWPWDGGEIMVARTQSRLCRSLRHSSIPHQSRRRIAWETCRAPASCPAPFQECPAPASGSLGLRREKAIPATRAEAKVEAIGERTNRSYQDLELLIRDDRPPFRGTDPEPCSKGPRGSGLHSLSIATSGWAIGRRGASGTWEPGFDEHVWRCGN